MVIRIVRIIARLNVGGPSIHVVNLSAGLDSERFRSQLVSGVENAREGSMLDYARQNGVKPITVPQMVAEANLRLRDAAALKKLYDLLRAERPHLVHTHTAKAGFLGRIAARIAQVPVVLHTYHGHVFTGYYGPRKSSMLVLMERMLARLSDCLVAVSEETKADLVRLGISGTDKIRVIPLGFNLEPFLRCGLLKNRLKKELRLDGRPRLVGIVGRIFPIKNHLLFLKAAAKISVHNELVEFVIVGDGVLAREMKNYASELGIRDKVHFLGWRRDLPSIYADLDVLVVSSDNEGTPVAAIEALASGCPVVATKVGGLPSVVEDNITGYLVPAGDYKALSQGVLTVLRDKRRAEAMGKMGRQIVEKRFAIERLVADTESLYEELLARKGILVSKPSKPQ